MYYGITFSDCYVHRAWDASKSEKENFRIVDNPFDLGDCVLMQFTGCFDKQGAKVWEGDVLRWDYIAPKDGLRLDHDHSTYYKVMYLKGGFCSVPFDLVPSDSVDAELEVDNYFFFSNGGTPACDTKVGNEYEHPELLRLTGEQPLGLMLVFSNPINQMQACPA